MEFKLKKQTETFSCSPRENSFEEGKWLLAVTSFEATNSVFDLTDQNNRFSIFTPSHFTSADGAETIDKRNKMLEQLSRNDIELRVKEVEKRRTRKEIENRGLCYSRL